MKGRIYYFTGTGNSMRAARVIAQRLGDVEIVSMRTDPKDYPATDCDIVGFVYPVYHWTLPAPAAAFVQGLDINPNAYVFVIAMPSFICGIACERLAEILSNKGVTIDYGNIVHSVANYAIVYPPFPPAGLRVPKTEKKLTRIANDIFKRKARPYPRASAFIKWRRERIMTPYLELQKYADNPFTISADCVSCGLCSRVCPCKNIVLVDGKPTFQHHCANCMACVVSCPKRAIGYDMMEITRQCSVIYATANHCFEAKATLCTNLTGQRNGLYVSHDIVLIDTMIEYALDKGNGDEVVGHHTSLRECRRAPERADRSSRRNRSSRRDWRRPDRPLHSCSDARRAACGHSVQGSWTCAPRSFSSCRLTSGTRSLDSMAACASPAKRFFNERNPERPSHRIRICHKEDSAAPEIILTTQARLRSEGRVGQTRAAGKRRKPPPRRREAKDRRHGAV